MKRVHPYSLTRNFAMMFDFLLKHLVSLIVNCQLHFYAVSVIIGVITAYVVRRFRFEVTKSSHVAVLSSKISFAWTTSIAAPTRSQCSPDIVDSNIGRCHLEILPADGSPEDGHAFEVFITFKNASLLALLWKKLLFWNKRTSQINFKISVSREKRNFPKQEEGRIGESEFIIAEESFRFNHFKNNFGPFAVNGDVINKCITPETHSLTFMVEIISTSGNNSSELGSCENCSNPLCLTYQKTEAVDEEEIEPIGNQDPDTSVPFDECRSPPDEDVDLKKLRDTLREVLRRKEFSDLKITLGTRTYHVHKAILAVRCPSITNMMSRDENEVKLEGVDPDVFGVVLEYLYFSEIDERLLGIISGDLLRAAVRLQMDDLKTLSEKHLLRTLNTTNAAERVQIAYECDSKSIKEVILQFIKAHKKEIRRSSPEWQSVLRCKWSNEILFDLLNTI